MQADAIANAVALATANTIHPMSVDETRAALRKLPLPNADFLGLDKLTLYPEFGRDVNPHKLAEMRRDYSPAVLGVISVSRHGDACVVLDGNHRITVAKETGVPEDVLCNVWDDLTEQQEAILYVWLNRMLKQTPGDLFKARLYFHDKAALDIQSVMTELEVPIYLGKGGGNTYGVRGITTIERIYAQAGRGGLVRTLQFVKAAFGKSQQSLQNFVLLGSYYALHAYPGRLDAADLVKRAWHTGFSRIHGMANDRNFDRRMPLPQAFADALVEVYNGGESPRRRLQPFRGKLPTMDPPDKPLRRKPATGRAANRQAVYNVGIDEVAARPS